MGLQVLGLKQIHKIEDVTGLPVARAVVNNGWQWRIWFFTPIDHRHGWYNRTDDDWGIEDEKETHWSSCAQLVGREPRDPARWTTCHRGHEQLTD